MATRSRIALKNNKGQYESIYCHYDGYVEHNGKMLKEHYNNFYKILGLISLGDISSLRQEVYIPENEVHTFDNPLKEVTVAYHRDRQEDFNSCTFNHLYDMVLHCYNEGEEFLYFYEGDKWFYIEINEVTVDKDYISYKVKQL